jgi:type I restriction enzyme S subunit
MPRCSWRDLRATAVFAPESVLAQQRIAVILTSLDTAIEATEALIEKHQQIRAGLMHDLFTRGVSDHGTSRRDARNGLIRTPLGPMPATWRSSTVGQSFEIDAGITLGPHRRPVKHAAPYLRVANIHRDELRLDDVAHIEAMAGDESCTLRSGDLLVVEGHANPAEIGRCAMVTDHAAGMLFQNHLFRLRAHAVSADFGLLWLNSFHMQRYWERTCSTSSGLHTINQRMLSKAPIYVPSIDEQARIVAIAGASRCRLETERTSLEKLRMQKQGLMQDLLTGKVSVQAD